MSELRRITDQYRLDKMISSGESGSVFRGVDTRSGEPVAVKLINTDLAIDEHRARFEQSCRALQSLAQPAIPRILDFGITTAGSAFLVTEYLHGTPLSSFAGSSPARLISLLLLLIDGLEALSRSGVPIPDLKAENVFVVPGAGGEQVKILGLGSSSFRPGVEEGFGSAVCSFALLASQVLGARVDLDGPGRIEIPAEIQRDVEQPEALQDLLERALGPDSEKRPSSYQEIRRALRYTLFGETGRTFAGERRSPLAPSVLHPPAEDDCSTGVRRLDDTMAIPQTAAPAAGPDNRTATIAIPWMPPSPPIPPTIQSPVSEVTTRIYPPDAFEPAGSPALETTPKGTVRIELPAKVTPPTAEPPDRLAGTADGTVLLPVAGWEAPTAPSPQPPFNAAGAMVLQPTLLLDPEPSVPPPSPIPPARETPESQVQAVEEPISPPVLPPPPVPPPPPPVAVVPPLPPPVASRPPDPVQELPPLSVEAPTASTPKLAAATAAKPKAGLGRGSLLVVAAVAALAVLGGAAFAVWRIFGQPAEPPPPSPVPVVVKQPATPPPPPVAPAPIPVNPQIVAAESYFNAGDLANAKLALEAIPSETQARFSAVELARYQALLDGMMPLQREELAGNLSRALNSSDLPLIRSVAGALQLQDQAALPPASQKELTRARKILELDSRLTRAQRSRNHAEVVRQASLLLAELPKSRRASQAREQSAAVLEKVADSAANSEQLDTALAQLEKLRQAWPERPGVSERLEKLRALRREEQQQEETLAAALRAGKANKPLEGLELLEKTTPSPRFAERFHQARADLEAQFARLDQGSPEIAVRSGFSFEFGKGENVSVPLRIADDQGVVGAEAWVRPEGGRYVKVPVRRVSGSDYSLEISPGQHQNKPIDFYVTATDQSGHEGQLGNSERPVKVKRKKWYDRILGNKNEDGEG